MPANQPPEIFARIYQLHGHRCPMSTLGGRLGLAARRGLANGEEVRAVYHIRTCALDGIAVTTGCREEDGSLRVEERGEHRLQLTFGAGAVTAALKPAALEIAGRYRRASEALERDRSHLSAEDRRTREVEVERILNEVLQALWTLPDEKLLEIIATGAEV